MKYLSLLFISFLFLTVNAQQADTMDWKTLDAVTYTINYPSDWEMNKPGMMGTSFHLFSPVEGPVDLFKENINLTEQDLSGYNLTMDQYVELSEGQLKTMISDCVVLSSERKTNPEFHQVIFTGKQGVYDLKFLQYYFIQNNKAYVLTLTCAVDSFDNYVEIGKKIMNSFVINP